MRSPSDTACRIRTMTLVVLVCVSDVSGQHAEPLPVPELLTMKRLTGSELSLSGQWAAMNVRQLAHSACHTDDQDAPQDTISVVIAGVRRNDLAEHNSQRCFPDSWAAVWSPIDDRVAFYSRNADHVQLKVFQAGSDSNSVLRLVPDPTGRQPPQWTSDGESLLLELRTRDAGKSLDRTTGVKVLQSNVKPSAVINSDSLEQLPNTTLALVNSRTGAIRERIPIHGDLIDYKMSPDSQFIAYTISAGFDSLHQNQSLATLSTVDLRNHETHIITTAMRMSGVSFSWAPDSSRLAFTTNDFTHPNTPVGDCFVVNRSGGDLRNITPGEHPPFADPNRGPVWDGVEKLYLISDYVYWALALRPSADRLWEIPTTPTNGTPHVATLDGYTILSLLTNLRGELVKRGPAVLVVVRNDATKASAILEVDVRSTQHRPMIEKNVSIGAVGGQTHVSCSRSVCTFVVQSEKDPPDAWLFDLQDMNLRRITDLNPGIRKSPLGTVRIIEWTSPRGGTARGALLLPSDYHSSRPYPLIVQVYPGESLSDNAYCFGLGRTGDPVGNMQLLASRGYAVLALDSIVHTDTPMATSAESILAGINKAIQLGIADPGRIGIMGHSFGGYGVLSALVQTARFRAAMESSGGYLDLFSMASKLDQQRSIYLSLTEQLLGATPWSAPSKYVQNSPVLHVDRVDTPLLIIQGLNDQTTPPYMADQLFVFLQRLGRSVEYAQYPGEGHWMGTWSYEHQSDYLHRMLKWFDGHLN